jgi:hypothetical protein
MTRMGYHWTPCDRGGGDGGGGGGGAAVLVIAAVLIIAAVARPVARAADAIGRVAIEVLEVAGIVAGCATALAVIAAAAWGARRAYAWRADRTTRVAFPRVAPAPPQRLSGPQRARAIEAPPGPMADAIADVLRHQHDENRRDRSRSR